MQSIFERVWRLGPAVLVAKAIFAAVIANGLLLAFILIRRTYRKSYFARRDARTFEFRQAWEQLISGELPYESWRKKPFDRRIVETIALDALEAARPEESARLLKFLRTSGLIEKRIFEARHLSGWRRMRALVALGRTRAPEGIPALAEALPDRNLEIRLAALRGLGRSACPQAGEAILEWLAESGMTVPALPLQNALVQCCVERPQLLVPYVRHAEGTVREVLGRVLGEIATPSIASDMLEFAGDSLPELRAAAARAMSHADPKLGLDVLSELVRDPIWFVRLRAVVSFGRLSSAQAISSLLIGLTDSHRLVRLRAAEAIVELKVNMAQIFEQVVATGDRYGLHAYLTALENRNLREKLKAEIDASQQMSQKMRRHLQKILQAGILSPGDLAPSESVPTDAAPAK